MSRVTYLIQLCVKLHIIATAQSDVVVIIATALLSFVAVVTLSTSRSTSCESKVIGYLKLDSEHTNNLSAEEAITLHCRLCYLSQETKHEQCSCVRLSRWTTPVDPIKHQRNRVDKPKKRTPFGTQPHLVFCLTLQVLIAKGNLLTLGRTVTLVDLSPRRQVSPTATVCI